MRIMPWGQMHGVAHMMVGAGMVICREAYRYSILGIYRYKAGRGTG